MEQIKESTRRSRSKLKSLFGKKSFASKKSELSVCDATAVQTSATPSSSSSTRLPAAAKAAAQPAPQEALAEPSPVVAQASVKVGSPANVSIQEPAKLDLWREAYDEVDEDTRKWIGDIPVDTDVTAATKELMGLVRDSEEKHKEETLKVEINGREIIWRDYADRVVTWLTTIGDIAITFAPAPSSAAWSAIKANVSQCKDLVAILGCTDIVLCLARRGRVYEEVYIGESPTTSAQEDLKKKLVSVYRECLEFLAFVDDRFKQNRLGGFLDALLDPEKGDKRVSALRDREGELDMATRACEAEFNQARSEKHERLLDSLQGPLKRIDERVAGMLREVEQAKRRTVMDYVSTVPVAEHHNGKREERTPETGEWLLTHSEFLTWEGAGCSSVFWLQGQMGTGKSFLSSKVIDHYQFDPSNPGQSTAQHDEGFAFFYCDRSDLARRKLHSILRSYIRQLSVTPRHPESIHQAPYNLYEKGGNIQAGITADDCKKMLVEIVNTYPRTTLVLDALDECDEETRQDLIGVFGYLIDHSERVLKIFIASRPEHDIREHMKVFEPVAHIDTTDNRGDIKKFVRQRISKHTAWTISEEMKIKVEETLVEKGNGMFRWTYLQWEVLKKLKSDLAVKQLLLKLPKDLKQAYDQLYEPKLDSPDGVILQRAVRWVICAREPLDSETLLPAIWSESEMMDEEGRRLFANT
ncbi:hypothetical protein ACJ41O_001087 [Fusarium nematophilum]